MFNSTILTLNSDVDQVVYRHINQFCKPILDGIQYIYMAYTSDQLSKKKNSVNCDYFLIHQFKHVFLEAQKNRLIETVLLSTHNICFG